MKTYVSKSFTQWLTLTGVAKERETQSTALMDLPAEIRNHIYELVLVKHAAIDISITIGKFDSFARRMSASCKQPALTRVSQALRRETLPMFYGENSFKINLAIMLPEPCYSRKFSDITIRWLCCIGATNRRLMNTIRIWSYVGSEEQAKQLSELRKHGISAKPEEQVEETGCGWYGTGSLCFGDQASQA